MTGLRVSHNVGLRIDCWAHVMFEDVGRASCWFHQIFYAAVPDWSLAFGRLFAGRIMAQVVVAP